YPRTLPAHSGGMPPEPLVIEDVTTHPLLGSRQRFYTDEGIRSLLAVPMNLHGEHTGTITFYYHSPQQFSNADVRVAAALANLGASVLVTAELYQSQRRARQRLQFLAEAGSVLSSSLDYERTLEQITRLAVPDLADWCAVDMFGPGPSVHRLALLHRDPAKVDAARELWQRYPPGASDPEGVMKVLRTGEPQLYPEITDEMLEAAAPDPDHLRVLRDLGLRSGIVVPLRVRGQVLGTLSFVYAESGRRYGVEDLAFLDEFASRAAAAVDNARLYAEIRRANEAKDGFIAMLGHELRNPLAAAKNAAHLLGRPDAAEDTRDRALKVLHRQLAHQTRLVDDLLDISRISRGRLTVRLEPMDFA
ncbi:MAG TPA: GAF domain-containing protein, partial [Armatimonadota bacterium]|nr:GAF domain-containing protein [Armatimonadota bacterium]